MTKDPMDTALLNLWEASRGRRAQGLPSFGPGLILADALSHGWPRIDLPENNGITTNCLRRPPVASFWVRLTAAIDVLLGRADAIHWSNQ